ncbi:MAG: BlaI/MecI/CopY family transcriptional regulator [Candidatus Sumerlaeaceae bacterium]
MPSKPPDSLPTVTNAEWEIMKVLWEHGRLAARDVYTLLPPDHGWATKTVKTLLSRLAAKGAIDYEQIGNSYLYRAACTREQVTRAEVRSFVSRVLEGSLRPVIAHFVEEHNLSDKEISELQKLLNSAKGRREKP